MNKKSVFLSIIFSLVIYGGLFADGGNNFVLIEKVIQIIEAGEIEIFDISISPTSSGIDMDYMIPMENQSGEGADMGHIKVSLSQADEWYILNYTMGFYYDLTNYLYLGLETAGNTVGNSMSFSLRTMANLKLGKNGLITGWYDVKNLIYGGNPVNDIYIQMSFNFSY